MADVRVDRSTQLPPAGVPAASGEQRRQRDPHGQPKERQPGGREELAVALGEPGRVLRAHLEDGPDGEPIVRVVDQTRNETVAVLTPEELGALAEQTGLPAGLLFQARS
jgi:hypothetical protein